jgi:hypothetical protein
MQGMLIVAATVLLGLVEHIAGVYAVHSSRECFWVVMLVLLHVGLAAALLTATRLRITTVANDFWAVTETAVTVFLVVELDDLVLFCVKRHPAVHAALCLLKVRPRNQRPVEYVHSITDHELYIADLVINTEQDLCALQTKLELLTNAQLLDRAKSMCRPMKSATSTPQLDRARSMVAKWEGQGGQDCQSRGPGVPYRRGPLAYADARNGTWSIEPEETRAKVIDLILEQCSGSCGRLFQPMEWVRTSVDLAAYKYFVEWFAGASRLV